MKRIFAILMAALLLLPACTKEIRTETLQLKEEIPFHEGSPNSLELLVDIDFPVAGFPKAALEEVRRTIRTHTFNDSYADFTGSLEEMGKHWCDAIAEDYRITSQSLLEDLEMSEDDAPFLNWGCERNGAFGEAYGHYINYMIDQYDYQGGAHGMYGTFPLVFDRKTGQAVSWETFAPGISEEKMTELLTRHRFDNLMDVINEDDLDMDNIFFSETIEPGSWFVVGEKGLDFYYQPYDIAPYVFGVITIPVPWDDLK